MFRKIIHRLVMECMWWLPLPVRTDPYKIVGSSFSGRGYADNPAAIIDELLRTNPAYTAYWIVNGEAEAQQLPTGIVPLVIDSWRSVYHLRTAGIWVDNCRKMPYVRKRRDQRYIQTWHGFALKQIEAHAVDKLKKGYARTARHDARMIDAMVSNSQFMSTIYRTGFWYDGHVLEVGSPRNDMLLRSTAAVAKRVKQALDIPSRKKVLVYAPTFRSDLGLAAYDLDYSQLLAAVTAHFGGDWVVALRLHPLVAGKSDALGVTYGEQVYDASAYPDTQELLATADALITDYSSVMFDYMLMGKPCFLYTTDLATYRTHDRGFYYDIRTTPFPLAEDQDELHQLIANFDMRRYRRGVRRFMQGFGFCEDGKAAERVVAWLESLRGKPSGS